MIKQLRWYERLWLWFKKLNCTVAVVCDRCGRRVLTNPPRAGMTMGYYHDWTHMTNEGEVDVCDRCMHTDPRYIKMYGPIRPASVGEHVCD